MASLRDHVSDVPVRTRVAANRVRVGASNAWHHAAGRRISGTRQGIRNARNQRTVERGRRDLPRRAADNLRSSLPAVRNRINPATGRPHRLDREFGRTSDAGLARMKAARQAEAARPSYRGRSRGGESDVLRDQAARQRLYGDPAGTWDQAVREARAAGRIPPAGRSPR